MFRILVVEDDRDLRELFCENLIDNGFKTAKSYIDLDTFKKEFEDYSLENFKYFINNVLLIQSIDDINFICTTIYFIFSLIALWDLYLTM